MQQDCMHKKEKSEKVHECEKKDFKLSSNNYTTCVKSNVIMEQNRLQRINSFKI
jgi:hypothetical protein